MNFLEAFWRSIFPECCLGCNTALARGEDMLCLGCKTELPVTDYSQHKENPLYLRFSPYISIEYAFALWHFNKEGIVQKLLHNLKYYNHPEISHYAGKAMGENLVKQGFIEKIDTVIPIPLHSARKQHRGYNQSAGFAQGIAEQLHIQWSDDWVVRNKSTQSQTRKSQEQRKKNVEGIFSIKDDTHIKNKNVLVVDDVITTGATILSCLDTMKKAGANKIFVGCIAVAIN